MLLLSRLERDPASALRVVKTAHAVEVVVLGLNRFRCPLTDVAALYE